MIEYIEAFLELGKRKDHVEDLRKVCLGLHTTESYMTQVQWEKYQKLLERIPKIPQHGNVSR